MKTCLVVDDSEIVRTVARSILEQLAFGVREAADGEGALAECRRDMPDAILLDWSMPVMNGMEFLRALRRIPGGDRPKVVFCTAKNALGQIKEALAAGADEYIMKPF